MFHIHMSIRINLYNWVRNSLKKGVSDKRVQSDMTCTSITLKRLLLSFILFIPFYTHTHAQQPTRGTDSHMFGSTNLYIGGEIALIGGVTVNCEIPMARKLTSSQLINSWLNFYFRMQGGYVYDLAIGGEGVGAILGMTCITGKKTIIVISLMV